MTTTVPELQNEQQLTIDLNVTAPKFDLKDIYGRTINLENYKGKKVFISFFRHAGCPFCNMRAHVLQKRYEEFKSKGLEMIFFFESPNEVLLNSTFHNEISPIPLIGDPEKVWYNTYGLSNEGPKVTFSFLTKFIQTAVKAKLKGLPNYTPKNGESPDTMPGEFLLDENLIIRKIHYSKGLTDRMSMEHIEGFVNS